MPLLFLSMPQSAPPCLSILWDSLAFPGMPCHYLRFTAFPHHIPCHSLQFPAIPSHSLPLSAVPCHFLLSPVVPCHSLQSPTLPSCYLPFLGIPHHSLPLPALPCSSPPFSAITSHSLLFPAISFYPLWFPAIPPPFPSPWWQRKSGALLSPTPQCEPEMGDKGRDSLSWGVAVKFRRYPSPPSQSGGLVQICPLPLYVDSEAVCPLQPTWGIYLGGRGSSPYPYPRRVRGGVHRELLT